MTSRHNVLFIAQEVLCLVHGLLTCAVFWIAAIFLTLTFRCLRTDLSNINKLFLVIFNYSHWLLEMACVINHIVSEVRVQHL